MTTTVSCTCGKVELRFPCTTTPRASLYCCCVDCQRRIELLSLKGGRPLMLDKPIRVLYFDDCISVSKGREELQFYKLTEDTVLFYLASKCCSTFLAAKHPLFHGNALAIPRDYCVVSSDAFDPNDDDADCCKETLVNRKRQWPDPDIKLGVPDIWATEDGQPTGTEGWEGAVQTLMEKFAAPIAIPDESSASSSSQKGGGETLKGLLEKASDPVIIAESEQ